MSSGADDPEETRVSKASEESRENTTVPRDDITFAFSPELSLEQRRYLAYLYARLNRPRVAERLAEVIFEELPGDKQTLLVLASMYLERRDTRQALQTAEELVMLFPDDHQALYFLGAAHYLAADYRRANEIFRDMKYSEFQGRIYPYETDLASSARNTGDWYRAMLAYQELLRRHHVSDELRQEIRFALDEIYRSYLPQVHVSSRWSWRDTATIQRSQATYERQLTDRSRFVVSVFHDTFSVDDRLMFAEHRERRMDWILALRRVHGQLYESEIRGGVSSGAPLAGLSLTRHLNTQREIIADVAFNERSRDSLAIELLNGRQNWLGVSLSTPLGSRDGLLAGLRLRQVHVDWKSVGMGIGGETVFERTLLRRRPELRAGYRGNVAFFFYDEDPFVLPKETARRVPRTGGVIDSSLLVRRWTNRHGFFLATSDDIFSAWSYRGTVGMDYEIVENSWQPYASAGILFRPRKSIEITFDIGYTASALEGNFESPEMYGELGLRYYF